jgi:hypothetical protein
LDQNSSEKTEYCIFSREKKEKEVINLKLGNHQLKYNKNTKILGLILDEQLNFNIHIEYIIKRAKRSLGIIREIKRIAGIPELTVVARHHGDNVVLLFMWF